MKPELETPLSDLMTAFAADKTPESFARLVDLFRRSKVGVIAVGAPPGTVGDITVTDERPMSLGLTYHGDRKARILAFADPLAFVRRFGQPFNADMTGEAVMNAAMHNVECMGVLLNSAVVASSATIDRGYIASLLGLPPLPPDQHQVQQPLPVLPMGTVQSARTPYRLAAMASWIIPLLAIAAWVLIPRPRGSQLDYTLTGAEHLCFIVGFLVGVISLIGSVRRGGSIASAIVGIVVNAFLILALHG
jgi:hypothetical protein